MGKRLLREPCFFREDRPPLTPDAVSCHNGPRNSAAAAAGKRRDTMIFQQNSHDLTLPLWGPYSQKYAGISHVADPNQGVRFDLSVFPGLYRRKVEVPNVMVEGNYHIWEASPQLTYFSTRHQIEAQDRVYCDISYGKLEEDAYLIRTQCVNHSGDIQNLVLHYMASLQFPVVKDGWSSREAPPVRWTLPEHCLYCRAVDYRRFTRDNPLPTDSLVTDGKRPNEVRGSGFSGGSAVKLQKGDKLDFVLDNPLPVSRPVLAVRYQSAQSCVLTAQGEHVAAEGPLPPREQLGFALVPISRWDHEDGSLSFSLWVEEGSLVVDSLILCQEEEASQLDCRPSPTPHVPQVWELGSDTPLDQGASPMLPLFQDAAKDRDTSRNFLILKYPDAPGYYGLYWDFPDYCLRYWLTDELDYSLRYLAHDHVRKVLTGNGRGHFSNVFLRPIPVKPQESLSVYGVVCRGDSREQVEQKVAELAARRESFPQAWERQHASALEAQGNPQGETYRFSQNRMIATTLTNVVYPIYVKRSYIRHNTPGRWWDSLYTWDSGFVGLGLASCDIQRAVDCLNAYVTEPGDQETAFIHHGSPVPVQFYLFQELYSRTQSRELLAYFYPRLLQYYRFMVGRLGSSATDPWQSGLLNVWNYFYNSGGWDDYPPQVAVHAQRLEGTTAGTVTTSHMIRCAKILCFAAQALGGLEKDIQELEGDIQRLTAAIQDHCWDQDSGYFGYLTHDSQGRPREIFRHKSGENFNKGLDGASPLLAGIVTPEQRSRLLEHLTSDKELWTPIGLSTVDQSAAYYKKDGYWNGAVWMPHQWFFFKALLDCGRGDLAFRIAKTALDLWKNETDQSYNCFEHFIILSGRGAGWHHFSGLSTPVLLWYQSYFQPGTITTGFSGWVVSQTWTEDRRGLECDLLFTDGEGPRTLVLVMAAGSSYQVTANGTAVSPVAREGAALEVTLETLPASGSVHLTVTPEP